MSPFVFRLDRFLRLRKHAELERAEALGAAVRAEEASKLDAEAKAERVNTVASGISAERGSVSSAGILRNLGLVLEAAVRQAESANDQHLDKKKETEIERELWDRARVERRMIERLKQRRQDAWASDAARAEQREMDETAARTRPQPRWGT
jgi:flagellar export protein FliJ